MLLSLVLYGSRARGDHRQKSDVDLLGVIEDGPIQKEMSAGGTSLYHYPSKLLMKKAENGDLFVLHLVEEGIVLHDSLDLFKTVKTSFQYKEDYSDEIASGYLVIKFFIERPHLLRGRAARKRLVWAIRTILIARCAERRQACFSSTALARVSGIPALKGVIDHRNQPNGKELLVVAAKVAERFGGTTRGEKWPSDKKSQRELMIEAGGLVSDTLRFIQPVRTIKPKYSPKVILGRPERDYG